MKNPMITDSEYATFKVRLGISGLGQLTGEFSPDGPYVDMPIVSLSYGIYMQLFDLIGYVVNAAKIGYVPSEDEVSMLLGSFENIVKTYLQIVQYYHDMLPRGKDSERSNDTLDRINAATQDYINMILGTSDLIEGLKALRCEDDTMVSNLSDYHDENCIDCNAMQESIESLSLEDMMSILFGDDDTSLTLGDMNQITEDIEDIEDILSNIGNMSDVLADLFDEDEEEDN